jgi:dihydrofolate synthase/folylpolyglutamate synthase
MSIPPAPSPNLAGEPVRAGGPAYLRFLQRLEATRTLGVSLGLGRMEAALTALGSPHLALPAVHIAGTNGKGSTAAMLDAILRAAGRRPGLFTSPHLARFTERIRLDGREVDGDHLEALADRIFATGVPLTYFEVANLLGWLAMLEARVDVAILEVGLGGRLDSTNLCAPIATAITSIGLDHTEILGDTLAAIAGEKAGIAKAGVPLYLGPVAQEAHAAIERHCASVGAPVIETGPLADAAALGLPGAHQRSNGALAVALARRVADVQGFGLDAAAVQAGLAQVQWPGRLEQVEPGLWMDAAHNLDGARALVTALPPARPRALVVSVVQGKAVAEMLATLAPAFDLVIATRSQSPRALPAADLAALLPEPARAGARIVDDPRDALVQARAAVGAKGAVVVAGSIFLIGGLRASVRGEPIDPLVTGDPMR